MNWLARLKNQQHPESDATKPTKPVLGVTKGGFVGFVVPTLAPTGKIGTELPHDPDRWCWPHSTAMNTVEIDTFTARLARFTDKGLSLDDGETLADRLVIRDREQGDWHFCFECTHLAGAGGWRCGNWQRAGVAIRARDAQLSADFVNLVQRCDGFNELSTCKQTAITTGEKP